MWCSVDLIYEMVQLTIANGMNPHYKYFLESFVGTEMDNAVEICAAVLNYLHADTDHKVILNLPTAVENCIPNQLYVGILHPEPPRSGAGYHLPPSPQ